MDPRAKLSRLGSTGRQSNPSASRDCEPGEELCQPGRLKVEPLQCVAQMSGSVTM
jgi:hypothetical protein